MKQIKLTLNLVNDGKEWLVLFDEVDVKNSSSNINNKIIIDNISVDFISTISLETIESKKNESKKELLKYLENHFKEEQKKLKQKYDLIMSTFSQEIKTVNGFKEYPKEAPVGYMTSIELSKQNSIPYMEFSIQPVDTVKNEDNIYINFDSCWVWMKNKRLSYLPIQTQLENIKKENINKLKSEIDNKFKIIDMKYRLIINTLSNYKIS